MQIERFNIDGIVAIVPVKRGDSRAFFSETYRKDVLAAAGSTSELVQDNHVYSADRGVLRGLHF
jgi:dTDP-4-dehydrorhamnose 3,5-epimerase